MRSISPIIIIIASLIIGLAPFSPPHIIGKIKWFLGGAEGMKVMDWFDLLMHGLPLLFAIFLIIMLVIGKWQIAK
jgi:hypothetical protein